MEKEIAEDEIDLRDYLKVIRKNKQLIVAFILVPLLATGFYSFFVMQKTYQTGAILYFSPLPTDFSSAGRYTNPNIIAQTFVSNDLLSKTVEQTNLIEIEPFKNSKTPKEDAILWLQKNMQVNTQTQDKLKLGDNQLAVTLKGSDPEILQNILSTHIKVVMEENKKSLTQDAQRDIEKIDISSASLVEQRNSTLKAIENIPQVNSTDKTVMLEIFITLNSRLTSIDDRLNALQMNRKNLVFTTSQYFNYVEVISSPYKPLEPNPAGRIQNMAIAGVLGLFIGIFAAFFKNYMEGSASE